MTSVNANISMPLVLHRYILRRAKEGFRSQVTPNQVERALAAAKEELQIVRRQSVVYKMYGRPTKNVLVSDVQCLLDVKHAQRKHGSMMKNRTMHSRLGYGWGLVCMKRVCAPVCSKTTCSQ